MNAKITQKEILLITNNSFAQREWCSKEAPVKKFTAIEQLEEACADGQIVEMLPEVFNAGEHQKLYLWQMRPGFSFIQLLYAAFPSTVERSASLDPHNWLTTSCYN